MTENIVLFFIIFHPFRRRLRDISILSWGVSTAVFLSPSLEAGASLVGGVQHLVCFMAADFAVEILVNF